MSSTHNDQTMDAVLQTLGDNAPTAVQEESRERAAEIQNIVNFLMAENRKFEKYDDDDDDDEEEEEEEEEEPFDECAEGYEVDCAWYTVDDSWRDFEDDDFDFVLNFEDAFTHCHNGFQATMDFTDVVLAVRKGLYDRDVSYDASVTRVDGQPFIYEYCPFYY